MEMVRWPERFADEPSLPRNCSQGRWTHADWTAGSSVMRLCMKARNLFRRSALLILLCCVPLAGCGSAPSWKEEVITFSGERMAVERQVIEGTLFDQQPSNMRFGPPVKGMAAILGAWPLFGLAGENRKRRDPTAAVVFDATAEAMPGLEAQKSQRASSADSSTNVVPMVVEEGMLSKTFASLQWSRQRWAASFCAAVLPLTGLDYARFVRLVREETVTIDTTTRSFARPREPSFQSFTDIATRAQVFGCLEQAGKNASADTHFDLYLMGASTFPTPPTNPLKWLRVAADGGQPLAQYLLATRILNYTPNDWAADGVPPPSEEERERLFFSHLSAAAESGVPLAQYLLGAMAVRGTKWVARHVDVPEGIAWLQRAASQGQDAEAHDGAATLLGYLYFSGKGVSRDYREAYRWYSAVPWERMTGCADGGLVRRQLGMMYRDGLGVEANAAVAEKYLAGNPGVCE